KRHRPAHLRGHPGRSLSALVLRAHVHEGPADGRDEALSRLRDIAVLPTRGLAQGAGLFPGRRHAASGASPIAMVSQPIEALGALLRLRSLSGRRRRASDITFRALAALCASLAIGAAFCLLAFLAHAGLRGVLHAGSQLLLGLGWKPEA